MDAPNDVKEQLSCGNNSRAISGDFQTLETDNLAEKIESFHQGHNRQHNEGINSFLGSLIGLPVELSNGIAG